jgi:hypothetical protein
MTSENRRETLCSRTAHLLGGSSETRSNGTGWCVDAEGDVGGPRPSLQNTYALAGAGQMPVIRLGRAMRLDPRMLAEWVFARGGPPGVGRN